MEISRELFEAQCKRRFGRTNPERMHMELWEWLVRTREQPFWLRQKLGLPPNTEWHAAKGLVSHGGPDWCFVRFGQSRTHLPDGRIICIAGECEDWYDPDFCIYNDVIVLRPAPGESEVTEGAGDVEIYGYPKRVFPPTDFHSATLVGERICIIGCTGYASDRKFGETPVRTLNIHSHEVHSVQTRGSAPGWIQRHYASYDPGRHAIVVRAGTRMDRDQRTTQSRDAYLLDLESSRWSVIAEREKYGTLVIRRRGRVEQEPPASALRPATAYHEFDAVDDCGAPTYRIILDHVRITLTLWPRSIEALVEGPLSPALEDFLRRELPENLRRATECEWVAGEVHPAP